MLISFLNDVDIQLIVEFKKSFGEYHPVCPKNPERAVFGTPCIFINIIQIQIMIWYDRINIFHDRMSLFQ